MQETTTPLGSINAGCYRSFRGNIWLLGAGHQTVAGKNDYHDQTYHK
jgi:hypothetical protein